MKESILNTCPNFGGHHIVCLKKYRLNKFIDFPCTEFGFEIYPNSKEDYKIIKDYLRERGLLYNSPCSEYGPYNISDELSIIPARVIFGEDLIYRAGEFWK